MKFSLMSLATLALVILTGACQQKRAVIQPAAAPASTKPTTAAAPTIQVQLQGHWLETSEVTPDGAKVKPDSDGYFPSSTADEKQLQLVNIDEKQVHYVFITPAKKVSGFDYDYKIEGDSISLRSETVEVLWPNYRVDGNNLELTYGDGSVEQYRKLSDDEFAKLQPPAQPAVVPAVQPAAPALTQPEPSDLDIDGLKI